MFGISLSNGNNCTKKHALNNLNWRPIHIRKWCTVCAITYTDMYDRFLDNSPLYTKKFLHGRNFRQFCQNKFHTKCISASSLDLRFFYVIISSYEIVVLHSCTKVYFNENVFVYCKQWLSMQVGNNEYLGSSPSSCIQESSDTDHCHSLRDHCKRWDSCWEVCLHT